MIELMIAIIVITIGVVGIIRLIPPAEELKEKNVKRGWDDLHFDSPKPTKWDDTQEVPEPTPEKVNHQGRSVNDYASVQKKLERLRESQEKRQKLERLRESQEKPPTIIYSKQMFQLPEDCHRIMWVDGQNDCIKLFYENSDGDFVYREIVVSTTKPHVPMVKRDVLFYR
jgi:hypothetical protein